MTARRRPMPSTAVCNVLGCKAIIRRGMLMCRSHWFQTPRDLRQAISSAWAEKRLRDHSANVLAARAWHTAHTPAEMGRAHHRRKAVKNKLTDLNNHLFAQLERLSEEGLDADKIEQEAKRADAIVALSDQVLRIADTQLKAVGLLANHGDRFIPMLPMLGKSE